MPYELREEGGGARVWNTETGKPLSAKPLAPRIAARQRDLLSRLEHDPAWKPQEDEPAELRKFLSAMRAKARSRAVTCW